VTIVVHLPQAILGMDHSLGEESIVHGRGLDMRDAERIAVDLDRAFEPLQAQGSGQRRHGCPQGV